MGPGQPLLAHVVGQPPGAGLVDAATLLALLPEELGRADISLALPVMYLVQASWGFVFERYASEELDEPPSSFAILPYIPEKLMRPSPMQLIDNGHPA